MDKDKENPASQNDNNIVVNITRSPGANVNMTAGRFLAGLKGPTVPVRQAANPGWGIPAPAPKPAETAAPAPKSNIIPFPQNS
jgi:hypothetical protein